MGFISSLPYLLGEKALMLLVELVQNARKDLVFMSLILLVIGHLFYIMESH
jgi:hypothetical protein